MLNYLIKHQVKCWKHTNNSKHWFNLVFWRLDIISPPQKCSSALLVTLRYTVVVKTSQTCYHSWSFFVQMCIFNAESIRNQTLGCWGGNLTTRTNESKTICMGFVGKKVKTNIRKPTTGNSHYEDIYKFSCLKKVKVKAEEMWKEVQSCFLTVLTGKGLWTGWCSWVSSVSSFQAQTRRAGKPVQIVWRPRQPVHLNVGGSRCRSPRFKWTTSPPQSVSPPSDVECCKTAFVFLRIYLVLL